MEEALARRAAAKSSGEENLPTTSQQQAFLQAVHKARDRLAGEKVGLDRLHEDLAALISKFRGHAEQLGKRGVWGRLNRDLRYVGSDARKLRRYEREVEDFLDDFTLSQDFAKDQRSALHELKERIHIEAAQNLLDFSMYEGKIRDLLLHAQAFLKQKKMDPALEKLEEVEKVLADEQRWVAALSSDLHEAGVIAEKYREQYWQDPAHIEGMIEQLTGEHLHHYLLAILGKPHLFPAATIDAVGLWLQKAELSKKQLIQVAEVYLELAQLDKAGDLYFKAKQYEKARGCYARSGNYKKQAEALVMLKSLKQAVQVCLEHKDYEAVARIYQEAGDQLQQLRFLFRNYVQLRDEEEILRMMEAARKNSQTELLAIMCLDVTDYNIFGDAAVAMDIIEEGLWLFKQVIESKQHLKILTRDQLEKLASTLKYRLASRIYQLSPVGQPISRIQDAEFYTYISRIIVYQVQRQGLVHSLYHYDKWARVCEAKEYWKLAGNIWAALVTYFPESKDIATFDWNYKECVRLAFLKGGSQQDILDVGEIWPEPALPQNRW